MSEENTKQVQPVVLLDCLSRRKWTLSALTIGPVLIAIVLLVVLPTTFEVTYSYTLGAEPPVPDEQTVLFKTFMHPGLDEKNFSIFLSRFYSSSTRSLIIKKMKEASIVPLMEKLQEVDRFDKFRKVIQLTTKPSYFTIDSEGNLKIVKYIAPEIVTRLQSLNVQAVDITITGYPQSDLLKTGNILRYVMEQTLPIYFVQDVIDNQLTVINARLASMESEKQSRKLDLEAVHGKLERLQGILHQGGHSSAQNEPVIHFENVGDQYLYLPISYQVQSLQSEAERLEENVKTVEKTLRYVAKLRTITQKIREEFLEKKEKEYTLSQHRLFVDGLIAQSQGQPEIMEYLTGYGRYLENLTLFCRPATEHPEVYRKTKHAAIIIAIAFFCGVFISLFSLYFLELLPQLRKIREFER